MDLVDRARTVLKHAPGLAGNVLAQSCPELPRAPYSPISPLKGSRATRARRAPWTAPGRAVALPNA